MRNKRIYTLGFFFGLIWLGMMGRVFYVQVLCGDYYANLAQKQSIQRSIIPPRRGEILDRNGNKLVVNADVEVSTSDSKNGGSRRLKRMAPNGHLAGQVIGNLGHDGYGQTGLEYQYDKELRGVDGWQYKRLDVRRRYYPGFGEEKKEPVDGANIVSSLDINIQKIAEQALQRGVEKVSAKSGVAIVMDPYTGDVLAMANYPFYNPNRRSKKDLQHWKNMGVSKTYEPGSTFKIITAAAGIEEGVVYPQEVLYGENGQFQIHGALVKDTKPQQNLTFTEAMAYSSNIIMVKVSLRMKKQDFYQYIRSFGFGMKTGIDLPAEEGGKLNPVRHWNARSQTTLSWGQELAVTPLQLLAAVGAVANGGSLMKPRMVIEHRDENGQVVTKYPIKKIRQVISHQTAESLKEMLTTVVAFGTANKIVTDKYSIAGKTGTVEKIDSETGGYIKGRFHASFIGMVPAEDPVYVALVLVDEPQTDKYGGSSAAPIFREIMDRILFLPGNAITPKLNLKKELNMAREESAPDTHPKNVKVEHSSLLSFPNMTENKVGVAPTTEVDHYVSENPILEMPNVEKKSLRDALLLLQNVPLRIEYRGLGQVIQQTPPPGTLIKPGQSCILQLEWMS